MCSVSRVSGQSATRKLGHPSARSCRAIAILLYFQVHVVAVADEAFE
jgi:hypothetical protein